MHVVKHFVFGSVLTMFADAQPVVIDSPRAPPAWALAERALIKEIAAAAAEFVAQVRRLGARVH
jgi:hypothetical protein